MRAALFTGQGSAHRGMGGELWEQFPDEVGLIDEVLGYSIRELCQQDPAGRLRDTEFAQPAIFAVSALQVLANPGAVRGIPMAGHSLGEFAALFAAGAFDLRTGVIIVRERGRLMGRVSGGMLAVLGLGADTLRARLRDHGFDQVDLANFNTAQQQVLSGQAADLERVRQALTTDTVTCVPLPVSGPFHSRYLREAQAGFAAFLDSVKDSIHDPAGEVYANVDGTTYRPGQVIDSLTRQITEPVRWHQILLDLRRRGVTEIVEIGPGTLQQRMWKHVVAEPLPEPPTRSHLAAVPPITAAAAGAGSSDDAGEVASELGSRAFREEYGVASTCVGGAMAWGIASTSMVSRLGRHGQLGFFGAGGLAIEQVAEAIRVLKAELGSRPFGMNLLHSPTRPELEEQAVRLYLDEGVNIVEAAAYITITPALVRYRFTGAHRDAAGRQRVPNRVIAKVSRPEVVTAFASPPEAGLLGQLVSQGALTRQEAAVAAQTPLSQDICVESDSGGHTDGGVALVRLPSLRRLCQRVASGYARPVSIRVGAAGGLGGPEAVAAAYLMGADFVVLGSVNQCSPEAGTSSSVKDMLTAVDIHGTAYAPAGDMFEYGAKVQVVRTGTMFPARGNKLYQLYQSHDRWADISERTRGQIERTWFRLGYDEVREQVRHRQAERLQFPPASAKAELAQVFRWYFARSVRLGLTGDPDRANYQIQCGPAMGAFNSLVKGSPLERWPTRHVERIAEVLMTGAEEILADARPGTTTIRPSIERYGRVR